MKTTLLIMAAGLGTRFKAGIKQLTPVGPNGERILDYSIHDAVEAGFDRVVFVIRRDLEADFRSRIGDRLEEEEICEVDYVFQELGDLPSGHTVPEGRTKPWGTAQAVLAARHSIQEPFCVINADDYYGKEGFVRIHDFLVRHASTKHQYGMVGFILKNTLSENGSVARGICQTDEQNLLQGVKETFGIIPTETGVGTEDGEVLDPEAYVSMNLWGFTPDFMECLEEGFTNFLDAAPDPCRDEYMIPAVVDRLIRTGEATVEVLESRDRWFGMTYAQDRDAVRKEFARMAEKKEKGQ